MTENLPAEPTRQAIEAKGRTAPGRVTGKLKAAIDRMVWFGDRRALAADAAGMKDHSLRQALRKPHVKAAYRAELAALRESERARNTHAQVDVRDNSDNAMARVAAAKELERSATEQSPFAGQGIQTQPGMVVVIVNSPAAPARRGAGPILWLAPQIIRTGTKASP
jgi:hypothetical protein